MSSSSLPSQPRSPPQQRRKPKMASDSDSDDRRANDGGAPAASYTSSSSSSSPSASSARSSPYLPTAREIVLLSVFPALLLFGALFSVLSPQTRAAAAASASSSAAGAAHYPQTPSAAPSYFARKDNVLNVFFVKRGWFWITVAFGLFVGTHPSFSAPSPSPSSSAPRKQLLGRRAAAVLRWGLVTGWWFLVTQWFFGPALIDRSFRLTGGGCDSLQALADEAATGDELLGSAGAHRLLGAATAAACKHAGGQWRGGHDISGHVFLLVLGSAFLAQEILWVLARQAARAAAARGVTGAGVPTGHGSSGSLRISDARSLVMGDGAVKSAEVEASPGDAGAGGLIQAGGGNSALLSRLAIRVATGVIGLCLWMLLMTAIYFHTWFEKLTGLLVALTGFYAVYIVPRWAPAVRRVVGIPGL